MAKTIVAFGSKGGVGKTLIATNLAVSLAKDQSKRVCLIDLDLQAAGDIAKILNINPKKAMIDIPNLAVCDLASLKKEGIILKVSLGIDFMAGILKPQSFSGLAESVKIIFEVLSSNYDYIIIDSGRSFNDIFINVLNQANLILMVVTPDILSIYQSKWVLDVLQSLLFPLNMVKIVLNRAEAMSSISWQEVQAGLPCDIIAKIPSEGKLTGISINKGIPAVKLNPKARFSLEIEKLGERLVNEPKLFLEHHTVDQLKLKNAPVEKPGEFWEKESIGAPLEQAISEKTDAILSLKRKIHGRIIEELNIKRLDLKAFTDVKKKKELRSKAETMVANFLSEEAGSFIPSQETRTKLVKDIIDEALGLGPLEDLLSMPDITDIMVNNKDQVYIENQGKIVLTEKKFISNEQVRTIIERIIAPIGRRIDESMPMVDARLTDGSRVNAIIPPLSLSGPTLTIRKFREEQYKIEELDKMGTLSFNMAEFLKACVLCRKNIIVSGGTGSGKTTILNILSMFIPDNERIVTIEDAAELKLNQEHWIRLESRPANMEGKGAITIRDLFRNTLRMRPDRIIIGECRGAESLDMLQAMNTGHDGSMTTVHANSTQDVVSRLDSMILMSGVELPIRAIREMIGSAIDVIVHTARLSDGTRKILQVSELSGITEDGRVEPKDVFSFKPTGLDSDGKVMGDFEATGYLPTFLNEIKLKGIKLSDSIFKAPTVR